MNSTLRNTASIGRWSVLLMVSHCTRSAMPCTSNSATFGKYYNWLVFFNAVGLVVAARPDRLQRLQADRAVSG